MLSHSDLNLYYKMIFALAQHHKYSITEIENLVPYERDIYFTMLLNFIEEQKERAKQKNE
jgi:DNA replication initiation complex subunit (GINS family)